MCGITRDVWDLPDKGFFKEAMNFTKDIVKPQVGDTFFVVFVFIMNHFLHHSRIPHQLPTSVHGLHAVLWIAHHFLHT